MRLYFASSDILMRAFVLEALGDLIAVDSSTARRACDALRTPTKNLCPLTVDSASIFITRMRKFSAGSKKLNKSCFNARGGVGLQIAINESFLTRSGMCAGISRLAQFR